MPNLACVPSPGSDCSLRWPPKLLAKTLSRSPITTLKSSFFAVAQHRDLHGLATPSIGHMVHQLLAAVDRFTIERDDDVASLEAAFLRWPTWLDLLDEDAFLAAVGLHEFVGSGLHRRQNGHADRATCHFAGLDDLVVDLDGGVDGQREADALIARRCGWRSWC